MSYSKIQAKIFGASVEDQQAFENRHYYDDNLAEIFKKIDDEKRPDIPSGLCAAIIDRCVDHLFPEGTTLSAQKGQENLVKQILDNTRLLEKLHLIGTEGHVTGTVGLKSIYDKETGKWTLDVYCVEALEIEHAALDAEKYESVRIRFRYKAKDERGEELEYWWQEKWTDTEYTEWHPQLVTSGQVPNFTADNINTDESGAHGYGEIPITIIQHKLQSHSPYGLPEIDSKMKAYSRKLSISLSKTGIADQLVQTPAYVRKNDRAKDRLDITPGAVIDIDSEGDGEPDLAALEHPEIPQSSFDYQQCLKNMAYDAAQVTNPDVEKEMRAGGTVSSVAWKAFNYHFVKKIKKLRLRYGDQGVETHVEKLLKMGKALKLSQYSKINPDDFKTYETQVVYPPFFEPTTDEKVAEINMNKQGNLPADELARRIAAILDIQDETMIGKIEANIVDEREFLKPAEPNRSF